METEEQINKEPQLVDDEVGALTQEQLVSNLQNDVEAYTKALEDIKKSEVRYAEQWEVDKKLWDILAEEDNHRKLNPEYGYEANAEFWELKKQKLLWKIEEDTHVANRRIEGYKEQAHQTQEALAKAQAKLDKFSEVKEDA